LTDLPPHIAEDSKKDKVPTRMFKNIMGVAATRCACATNQFLQTQDTQIVQRLLESLALAPN
jgi:hypothetical protein